MSTSIKLQTEVCIPVSCNLHLHQSQQLLADFDLSRVSAMYTCGASPGQPNNVRNCCRSLTNYSCPDEQIVTRGNNLTSWQNRCKIFIFTQYTVLVKRVQYFAFSYSLTPAMNWYFVLFNNSFKFWSIIKTRDSFGICSSWGFQNCPWKLNLTKICLS